jgi:transposase
LKKQPDQAIYQIKKEQLIELARLENIEEIDLFFTDETGFNLTPNIPYGWQPIGEQWTIRSSKTKVTNLFGLMSQRGQLQVYASLENIDSIFIIECINDFIKSIQKPTVLVMDNAPWHKAKRVLDKQKHWQEKGLFLFFLPPYSPHLNLIETLWRKIKYEWLRSKDYESAKTLRNAIFNIIRKFDDEFSINFSKNFLNYS